MADRDDLTLADMANDPGILRLTVRPEGVAAPPLTDAGWGGFGALGRPTGRLFEPDLSQSPTETVFQQGIRATPWFSEFKAKHGEEPNLDDPNYDYRKAWAAGSRPNVRDPGDQMLHWSSEFKGPDHPNRFVGGVDTITGQPAQRPTIGERIGLKPVDWWPSPTGVGAAIGRGIGGLVQGAGSAVQSAFNAPPVQPGAAPDPTAAPRAMWQQNYPSAQTAPSLLDRGAQAIATEIAHIPGHIRQGYEHSATSLEGPPELREPARRGAVERATDVNLNLAGAGMAGASIRGGASAGVFGGRLAKGFDPNREKLAEQMELNGVSPQQIWRETRMVKFADGKWAHEIPDIGASYKGDVDSMAKRIFDRMNPDRVGQYDKNPARLDSARNIALLKIQGKHQLFLPDVIDHPRLFAAYPELERMPVSHDAFMHAQGVYYPESMAGKDIQQRNIKYREQDIGTRKGRGQTLDTLLHEIQHAIQQIEGMAKGTSTEPTLSRMQGTAANRYYMEEMKKAPAALTEDEFLRLNPKATFDDYAKYYDKVDKQRKIFQEDAEFNAAWRAYTESAGENLAEIVPQRRNMTPEQLAAINPTSQMRMPLEAQNVEFNRLVNPAGTSPQARMGGVLGLEGPQMSAGPSPLLRPPGRTMKEENWQPTKPTVLDPRRVFSPEIYRNPRLIAERAAQNVAAEHPALKELFGVTRADLYDISQQGRRKGNMEPEIFAPKKPGESYVAEGLATPQNEQRIIDTLGEGLKHRGLREGMVPWYVMDPMFQHMVKLVGKEQAIKDYQRFNATTAPFSASSDVMTELNRGTAANMYAKRGDYPTFHQFAGADRNKLPPGFPADMSNVAGHAYHAIQSDPVVRWLATGKHGYGKEIVKIPTYHAASGVPEVGFQTRWPVPDAHFARGVGAADVRDTAKPGVAMKGAEYRSMAPWYREKIAEPLGIEAVPAQALQWGTMSRATGVDTAIGAGKLELLSQRIWERAQQLGIDPKTLRDQVLRGDAGALLAIGVVGGGAGAAGIGSVVDPSKYQPGGT